MKRSIITLSIALGLLSQCKQASNDDINAVSRGQLGYSCKNLPKNNTTSSSGTCDSGQGSCYLGKCVNALGSTCSAAGQCSTERSGAICGGPNYGTLNRCCIQGGYTANSASECCSTKFKSGTTCKDVPGSSSSSLGSGEEGEEGGKCKSGDKCDDDLVCIKKSSVDDDYETLFDNSKQCFACGGSGQPCCKDNKCEDDDQECRKPESGEDDGTFGDDFKYCLDKD